MLILRAGLLILQVSSVPERLPSQVRQRLDDLWHFLYPGSSGRMIHLGKQPDHVTCCHIIRHTQQTCSNRQAHWPRQPERPVQARLDLIRHTA